MSKHRLPAAKDSIMLPKIELYGSERNNYVFSKGIERRVENLQAQSDLIKTTPEGFEREATCAL